MEVLLLCPKYPDTFWSFKDTLKFIGKRAALPTLRLFTVAVMLAQEWQQRLVDVNVLKLRDADMAWADLVDDQRDDRPARFGAPVDRLGSIPD